VNESETNSRFLLKMGHCILTSKYGCAMLGTRPLTNLEFKGETSVFA